MASNTQRAKQRRAAYWVLIHPKKQKRNAEISRINKMIEKAEIESAKNNIFSKIKNFFVLLWATIKRTLKLR